MELLMKNHMVEAQRKGQLHDVVDDDDDLVHSSSSDISNGSSMESDSSEEETSSKFLPSLSSSSSSSSSEAAAQDSLSDMSSLLQQLPIKMGLSRYYNGKSRSFTSLANVRSLEDLGKEENAEKKMKKKSCRKSYGGGRRLRRTNALSRNISKKEWNSRRPPIPHRSTISNQTLLFD